MSQGTALPTPFPPAIISPSVPVCELVDDGSTSDINYSNRERSTVTQTVKVTGLDDTNSALGQAITAALAAFPSPTYQPFGACMVVTRIEPTIGIDGVRRQSMIAARGATDDNNTTGTVAVFRLVYGFPTNLGGVTSYEFIGGGITYDQNTLDTLESTGSITVRVTGPTTSALAKAQAVAMFPTHPNNSSLAIISSSVRYEGGGTCSSAWVVTLGYGCVKARAYGIVGNQVNENLNNGLQSTGSLTISSRGQASVAAAIAAAAAAYPSHPSLAGISLSGWSGRASENACDGLMTDVTLHYDNQFNSGGTGDAGTLDLAQYDTMYEERDSYIPSETWDITTQLVIGTEYAMNPKNEKRKVHVPFFRFIVPWNTSTTLLTWAAGLSGSINSNAYSIGGRSWPPNSLRMAGVKETVVKNAAGTIKHINTIIIDACTRGFLSEEPNLSNGMAKVKAGYVQKTFTVPTPSSIP